MAAYDVAKHFEASPNPEPLVVMSVVSITLFNKYFAGHDEDAPVAMRFVNLVDGSIVITDYPSAAHEVVTGLFELFLAEASGVLGCIVPKRSTTARRAGFVSKEADATLGPYNNTPNAGRFQPAFPESATRILPELAYTPKVGTTITRSEEISLSRCTSAKSRRPRCGLP
ncbi:hypothetical protein ACHHYP_20478 [Achlya hypogyna]|uniref:Uncharacterized protein n=1 Tax=Achlya hypogyna TaxID=1202772 RepID=A0A1V9YLG2_ACHHY|nr:hypothetical protein ACHHYP_20478 [Achlya hypogyna]